MQMSSQKEVANQRPLPTKNSGSSSIVTRHTEPSVQLFYYNSGTFTPDAGQAAGEVVVAQIGRRGVLAEIGDVIATANDTSLSFTSTALTTEVFIDPREFEKYDLYTGANKAVQITSTLSNGQYVVDYLNGKIYGKKASTQTALTSLSYRLSVDSSVAPTRKSRLTSAAAFLEVTGVDGSQFHEARVTNGATAQYIQVWDAEDEADISANGVLKEVVWATADLSFSISPKDPTEQFARGIVVAGSSNASGLAYTAGANLGFTVVEYVTPTS